VAKEEYTFTLRPDELTERERGILDEAVEDGYYEGTVEEDFTSLARRFSSHRAVNSDEWGDDWLVEYEGTLYVADLSHPPSALEDE